MSCGKLLRFAPPLENHRASGLSWAAEKQHIAVRVSDLEAAQTVGRIPAGIAERDAARRELRRQSVRIGRGAIGIPSHRRIAPGIGQWRSLARLEEEHRPVATDDCEKWLLIRFLKSRLEAELLLIEGDALLDAAYDEERAHGLDLRPRHKATSPFPSPDCA